ncbi:type I-B CRISPR-associated protein Cas5b [Thiorhodospira sibirica]|uniref:type I-B CRISPR-associated protein Cas5b n=1 Tax=Thiorhodospira sibirica TaxID=154347 RepID=UPI00022C178F|nr:type I-B CRISPR-associated protein Cas5b [Thiorhodospira sibirica]
MRTLVFEVSGEYALFKKPYSPMSPVSYPLPPPPAVLGMLGAILGLDKNAYHHTLQWAQVRVAVSPAAPLRFFRAALNLLQTKDGTDRYFRPRADKNTHTQVPFTFLREPRFRILVAGLASPHADAIATALQNGTSRYTVTLGLANCLADLRWIGEWNAEAISAGDYAVNTVLPLCEGMHLHYEAGRRYHRLRIPASMDPQRVVHRYQEIVLAEDAQPMRVRVPDGVLYHVNTGPVAFL